MRNFEYVLDQLSRMQGIEITCYSKQRFWDLRRYISYNPIRESGGLREHLMEIADAQREPVLYEDSNKVMFACIRREDAYFFLGPFSLHHMEMIELHRYYRFYGMERGMEKPLPVITFHKMMAFLGIAAVTLLGEQFSDREILRANHLDENIGEQDEKDKIMFGFQAEDEEEYHHTYREEKLLLERVRAGMTSEALELSMRMDQEIGKLSRNELEHWRKLVTVAIALCTRAAIEGGLSPAEAYQVSDYHIQKSDGCKDVPALIACRNYAVRDLTERVRRKKESSAKSGYTAAACVYVGNHYREKIYLKDIAEKLKISPSYLSRVFSKDMDMKLQDYIVQVRVERAANLLRYSEERISEIGDYVNFPSQSYFGKIFKKYTGMTPKEYRERYKPKEF